MYPYHSLFVFLLEEYQMVVSGHFFVISQHEYLNYKIPLNFSTD